MEALLCLPERIPALLAASKYWPDTIYMCVCMYVCMYVCVYG